mgnify:CR=1 FL=1
MEDTIVNEKNKYNKAYTINILCRWFKKNVRYWGTRKKKFYK